VKREEALLTFLGARRCIPCVSGRPMPLPCACRAAPDSCCHPPPRPPPAACCTRRRSTASACAASRTPSRRFACWSTCPPPRAPSATSTTSAWTPPSRWAAAPGAPPPSPTVSAPHPAAPLPASWPGWPPRPWRARAGWGAWPLCWTCPPTPPTMGCGARSCLAPPPADVGPSHLLNIKSGIERRDNMLWFRVPPKVYFKGGCLEPALRELRGKRRAFIVTGGRGGAAPEGRGGRAHPRTARPSAPAPSLPPVCCPLACRPPHAFPAADKPLFDLGYADQVTRILDAVNIQHQVGPRSVCVCVCVVVGVGGGGATSSTRWGHGACVCFGGGAAPGGAQSMTVCGGGGRGEGRVAPHAAHGAQGWSAGWPSGQGVQPWPGAACWPPRRAP
jgi:hypothetical protein